MRGRSGNPGGRPKAALDVQALARRHTEPAIRALIEALRDPRLKVQAAQALLDRGWGKPAQTIHAQSEATVLHLIAAQEAGDELLRNPLKPTMDGDAVEHETQQILPLPEE